MNESKLFRAMLKNQQTANRVVAEPQPSHDTGLGSPTANTTDIQAASLARIGNPRPFTRAELAERKIIYSGMPKREMLNAYREARIKLKNRQAGSNAVVLVSSLSTRSSSTLTTYNLAVSFALDLQNSALLVDCNPYDSNLQALVTSTFEHGITDYVQDKRLRPEDIIYASGVDRLSVIPAGHVESSAVELFSSSRMRELMSEVRQRYPDRYIILHAPSIRVTTEPHVLLDYCDQAVLTVPFGELTVDGIMDSIEELGTEKFAGLIYQE